MRGEAACQCPIRARRDRLASSLSKPHQFRPRIISLQTVPIAPTEKILPCAAVRSARSAATTTIADR
jgi:hypothetical protein